MKNDEGFSETLFPRNINCTVETRRIRQHSFPFELLHFKFQHLPLWIHCLFKYSKELLCNDSMFHEMFFSCNGLLCPLIYDCISCLWSMHLIEVAVWQTPWCWVNEIIFWGQSSEQKATKRSRCLIIKIWVPISQPFSEGT